MHESAERVPEVKMEGRLAHHLSHVNTKNSAGWTDFAGGEEAIKPSTAAKIHHSLALHILYHKLADIQRAARSESSLSSAGGDIVDLGEIRNEQWVATSFSNVSLLGHQCCGQWIISQRVSNPSAEGGIDLILRSKSVEFLHIGVHGLGYVSSHGWPDNNLACCAMTGGNEDESLVNISMAVRASLFDFKRIPYIKG